MKRKLLCLPESDSLIWMYNIDGVLNSEKSKPVGPEIEMVSLTFSGEQGSITVSIKFGNYIVKQYVIYFDNCTYREF